MKNAVLIPLLFLLADPPQKTTPPAPASDFIFLVTPEKNVLKPGEAIWVTAFLRNQSDHDVYIPHAMTPCSGLEAEVVFVTRVVKGKLLNAGRGCGVGSSCTDCSQPAGFPERIKQSWIRLSPGELWGARFDSFADAPKSPGTYEIRATYEPRNFTESELLEATKADISIIHSRYPATAFEIEVKR